MDCNLSENGVIWWMRSTQNCVTWVYSKLW